MASTATKVLIVDDDAEVLGSVAEYLSLHGFDIATASGGAEMRARLEGSEPDLIILDLSMPGEDGLSLVRWLRKERSTPVIMLTALDEPADRVVGLEMGVDDYIGKPFHPRELVARVRTVLRRVAPPAEQPRAASDEVAFGPSLFNRATGRLIDPAGQAHLLTGMELDLLRAFADHPNEILSRDRLLALAHRGDWDPFDRSIDVRISRIRRKLGIDGRSPIIRAVRNMGYIFEPDAKVPEGGS